MSLAWESVAPRLAEPPDTYGVAKDADCHTSVRTGSQ